MASARIWQHLGPWAQNGDHHLWLELHTQVLRALRLMRAADASIASSSTPLSDCLVREFRAVQRCVTPGKALGSDDFFEGIRAALIDKDRNPQWSPKDVAEVSEASIEAYLTPLDAELSLPRLPGFAAP